MSPRSAPGTSSGGKSRATTPAVTSPAHSAGGTAQFESACSAAARRVAAAAAASSLRDHDSLSRYAGRRVDACSVQR